MPRTRVTRCKWIHFSNNPANSPEHPQHMRTFGAFERDFFVRIKAAFSGGYLLDVRNHVASGWHGFHSIHSAFYTLNSLFTCERNIKSGGEVNVCQLHHKLHQQRMKTGQNLWLVSIIKCKKHQLLQNVPNSHCGTSFSSPAQRQLTFIYILSPLSRCFHLFLSHHQNCDQSYKMDT